MGKTEVLDEVGREGSEATDIADKVIEDSSKLPELFIGVSSTDPRIRFGSAKILRVISEKRPEILYSSIDFFVRLLDDENSIIKWNAMDIIANLMTADSQGKFNRLFKKFYSHLYEGSLITAGHIVDNSGKIALAKPELRSQITGELLKVEGIPLPTEECRSILIGKIINAFAVYYDEIRKNKDIISFVKRQLKNPRKATRVKAEKFLRRLEKQRR